MYDLIIQLKLFVMQLFFSRIQNFATDFHNGLLEIFQTKPSSYAMHNDILQNMTSHLCNYRVPLKSVS